MIVSERVSERMSELGLSQSELARRVGVAQPTIYKLLRTSKKGSAHLHKIARELQTTPSYLSGETDDPHEGADLGQRLSSDELDWLEIYARLTESQRRMARGLLGDLANGNEPRERADESRSAGGSLDRQ